MERNREGWQQVEREIKQNMGTTHGSSGILLVLLHPGFLSGGDPGVIVLQVPPLYSPSSVYSQGGCRCPP